MHPGEHSLRVILADRVRRHAKGDGAGHLHLVEEAIAQRLLVEGDVVAAPDRGHKQVGARRHDLGDVGSKVGGTELRPVLGHHLGPREQPLDRQGEVLESVAPVGIVRMDVGYLAHIWPGLRHSDSCSDPVGRLDVGDPKNEFRVGDGFVEQEVGAPVGEDRQERKLLGHWPERRRIGAGDDAGEQVNIGVELHPPQFFDIGVGTGCLVCGDRLDLALTEQPALGVDLLRRHRMALERRLAEHRSGAGQERHMANLVWRVGNAALRGFLLRLEDTGATNHAGAGESRPANSHAQTVEKATTTCG